ncbi:C40 family peptidase [Arthrobacter sp. H5]|uniref:C40 family peptidase n=1 Tax=Arthrobacter sp. H5 TaxID=1267973 RepID=UPI000684DCAE|nr:C40 family peptidase [Arthrobacter sp. H5]
MVPYRGGRHPGAAADPITEGANCQRYAYEVLELFGRRVPRHRSSELWLDPSAKTVAHGEVTPLDLVLFNRTAQPYGAHVGLYMAPDRILHLCAEIGIPAVWTWADFASRARYAAFVGAKRYLP